MAQLGVCKCCSNMVSDEAKNCPHCGQPNPYVDRFALDIDRLALANQVARKHIAKGQRIEAIKEVRALMGWDLKKAKNFIDSL